MFLDSDGSVYSNSGKDSIRRCLRPLLDDHLHRRCGRAVKAALPYSSRSTSAERVWRRTLPIGRISLTQVAPTSCGSMPSEIHARRTRRARFAAYGVAAAWLEPEDATSPAPPGIRRQPGAGRAADPASKGHPRRGAQELRPQHVGSPALSKHPRSGLFACYCSFDGIRFKAWPAARQTNCGHGAA